MGLLRLILLALAATVAAGLAAAASAEAAFPGENGRIVFHSGAGGNFDVFAVNPDGTGLVQLTDHPAADMNPTWSPDGTRIAFASRRDGTWEIYVMNGDGSGLARITQTPVPDYDPAWSPDGTKIAFARGDVVSATEKIDVWTMNADGSGQARLTDSDVLERGGESVQPAWSPDGQAVAFSDFTPNDYDLLRINADGSGTAPLWAAPGSDEMWPDWSPDGTTLVFQTSILDDDGETTGRWNLATVRSDGTGFTRLTDNASTVSGTDDRPAYSPDGTKIVSGSPGGGLHVRNADGTGKQFLVPGGAPDWQPLPGPQRGDFRNAAQFCRAERDFLGPAPFSARYGGGANAFGKCAANA